MFKILEKIWLKNWFVILCVSIVLLFAYYSNILQPLEQSLYNLGIQKYTTNNKIAIVAGDDFNQIWPNLSQFINLLAPHTQAIGINLPLNKFPQNFEYFHIEQLLNTYQKLFDDSSIEQLDILLKKIQTVRTRYNKKIVDQLHKNYQTLPSNLIKFKQNLQDTSISLNFEQRLIDSFKQANNVILGASIVSEATQSDYILKHSLVNVRESFDNSHVTLELEIEPPLAQLSNNVVGVGYTGYSDPHNVPLVIKYKNNYFPSLALRLVTKNLENIEVQLGKGIRLEHRLIKTDNKLRIRPFTYPNLTVDSFTDVLTGKIPVTKYKDKIVLLNIVPHSEFYGNKSTFFTQSNTLTSLLNQEFVTIPTWTIWIQISIFVTILIYLGFLWEHLKWNTSLVTSICLMLVLVLLYFILLSKGLLVQLMLFILLVLIGHIILQLKNWVMTYHDVFRLLPDAVASNRLLGLAFQGQGYLDLAFEKFCLCPPNESIIGLLYNLGLDYERKREAYRARLVYRYIEAQSPDFRDTAQRLINLKKVSRKSLNDWQLEESGSILGQYQIEKPLGRGAMGTVYLGKDSKLNRLVAIKTLPLSQEFGSEQLQEATVRFFQEASAAGRLKHSNIVSIYDAGEEQNLAYISMEFFKGGTLVPYTQKDNLLPIVNVLNIVILIAEALDYAHSHGVIHRDIKPANIMYNPATNKIKITDFGIARITDANRTRTGIILGTPSYMSPEQLAAKKLDGRSDLFSLGVMLYQLLSGVLPFESKSLTTLMFKIANEPHKDISKIYPKTPNCIKQVIDIALNKEIKSRYQSGTQFAIALRDCNKFEEGIK
ncbi:protein kinase [Thiotrichales bacterium HSG1]|nr:protein kinase [Thiotrichales bacterium HSG1]